MKLKNKLLPLTGIAVATASITPFIASCGSNKGYTGSWEWDVKEGFHVATTPRESEEFDLNKTYEENNAAILTQFAEDVKNDYNVFYDDFAITKINANALPAWILSSCFAPTHISLQINNVDTLTYEDQIEVDLNHTVMLLSFTAHLEGFVLGYEGKEIETAVLTHVQYTSCDFEATDIPYSVDQQALNASESGGRHVIAFTIPRNGSVWSEIENWNARIKISQSGLTNEQVVNAETMLDNPNIDFPLVQPGLQSGSVPATGYLQIIFNLVGGDLNPIGSYHYSLATFKEPI